MEVKFNGKTVSVTDIGNNMASSLINNAVSSKNTKIEKCFSDAYRIVLKSRFDTSKGVATKSLLNSINLTLKKYNVSKVNNHLAVIAMTHGLDFNDYGFYVGAEKFKKPKKKPSKEAIVRMTEWVKVKKGSFDFSVKATKKISKEEKIARIILYSWANGAERNVVLPKWYDVFKDGNKEVIDALVNNRKCIENSIKDMLNG